MRHSLPPEYQRPTTDLGVRGSTPLGHATSELGPEPLGSQDPDPKSSTIKAS
jgi:hypothetical protein